MELSGGVKPQKADVAVILIIACYWLTVALDVADKGTVYFTSIRPSETSEFQIGECRIACLSAVTDVYVLCVQ